MNLLFITQCMAHCSPLRVSQLFSFYLKGVKSFNLCLFKFQAPLFMLLNFAQGSCFLMSFTFFGLFYSSLSKLKG